MLSNVRGFLTSRASKGDGKLEIRFLSHGPRRRYNQLFNLVQKYHFNEEGQKLCFQFDFNFRLHIFNKESKRFLYLY